MDIKVPTLSRAGWVTSTQEKIDFLFSDFFTSDFSQSYFFNNEISSITYLIQKYKDDLNKLTNAIEGTLERYLGRYFEHVNITVLQNSSEVIDGKVTVTIEATIVDNDKVYSVAKLIESSDGHIKKITELNNTGRII